MGSSLRFLALDTNRDAVVNWLSALPDAPEVVHTPTSVAVYFSKLGPLATDDVGSVVARRSPVVNVFLPKRTREVLWTVGEVHVLPTPLRESFPRLHAVSRSLRAWLGKLPRMFPPKTRPGEWDYFLEGSVLNFDSPIFAFPDAMAALRAGQYFVSDRESDSTLDVLCRQLRLRGVPAPAGTPTA